MEKILIVDDEKAIRLGLSKCIEASGFTPLEAADGYEALHGDEPFFTAGREELGAAVGGQEDAFRRGASNQLSHKILLIRGKRCPLYLS